MAGFPAIDFVQFHESDLPRRIASGNGALGYAAARGLGTLALQSTGGPAFSYVPRNQTVEVVAGADQADTVVEVTPADFSDLANDLAAAAGLFYPGKVRVLRGEPRRFLDWEPAWRSLFHGRPVYDPDELDLRDPLGAPLDPSRSFASDDPLPDIKHFLETAGYVRVRSVFDAKEIEAFRRAAADAADKASEADDNSWWGVTTSGEKRLTRILEARDEPAFQDLVNDPRLNRLVDVLGLGLQPDLLGETVTVLFKIKDVAEGLANLPWHRDCGMGGHALHCPIVNLTIFLTACNRDTGGLWMLPGSHAYSCPTSLLRADEPAGSVLIEAEPGDVTLHLSDTMHAAFPPTGDGVLRESLILTWKPPGARPHDGQTHYNDAIKGEAGVPVARDRRSAS